MLKDLLKGKCRDITPKGRECCFDSLGGGGGCDLVIACEAIDGVYGRFNFDTMRIVSGSYADTVKKIKENGYADIRFYCVSVNEETVYSYANHLVANVRWVGNEIELSVMTDDNVVTVFFNADGEFHPDWG